jgi:Attacin, C-terminal region
LGYSHTEGLGTRNDRYQGTVKLYENGNNRVNFNAFYGKTRRHKRQDDPGTVRGGNIEWQHSNGHSASFGLSQNAERGKPVQQSADVQGNYNIWRNKDTSFDAYAGASRQIGPNRNGGTDWNTGFTIKRRF